MKNTRDCLRTAFLIAVSLLVAAPALAYIPPSAFILKSVASKHAGVKGLRIRTLVTGMEGEKLSGAHFKEITYFNPQTLILRSYALDDSGQRLYGVERKRDSASASDALLFWANSRGVDAILKNKGIPIQSEEDLAKLKDEEERHSVEQEWFSRWFNSVAWVIGAPGKTGRNEPPTDPQLWVEKDTFLPLRLIVSSETGKTLYDLQMEGQRYYHEFPFPRVIVAVKNGREPVLRDEVQEVAMTLDVKEFSTPLAAGYTEAGNAAPSPIRELIRNYYELVR